MRKKLLLAVAIIILIVSPFLLGAKGHRVKLRHIYDLAFEIYEMINPLPKVAKTGQTISYKPRDDGDLEMGAPWPNPRFYDKNDGTIKDNLTGLIWLQDADCFGESTWPAALNNCHGLASGDCNLTDGSVVGDWRLPNARELHSMVDYGNSGPALPTGHPFTGLPTGSRFYWSSTATASVTTNIWRVDMGQGSVKSRGETSNGHVWPVRNSNE